MNEFRFKRFTVKNEDSPMKVGTDGVLLGAAARVSGGERRILDIGTGTGVIALMLAQRAPLAEIVGVEIDAAAAAEAAFNFGRSPWKERMSVSACALGDFHPEGCFDLIVSNPPYFDNSLQNPDARRSGARHNVSLSYREILPFAAANLTSGGRLALILPSDLRQPLLREARSHSLYAERVLSIRSTPRKAASRIIAEFSRERTAAAEETELTLHDGNGYSEEYLELTRDFYLFA